jgi:hypothetical protein
MRFYVKLGFSLIVFTAGNNCLSQDFPKITQDQKTKVEAMLADYSANRAVLGRSAAVFSCETTRINLKRPEESGAELRWYGVSANGKEGTESVLRFDQTAYSGVRDLTVSTFFANRNREVEQFIHGKSVKKWSIATESAEQESTEEESAVARFVRFDPLNLPFDGIASLQAHSVLMLQNAPREFRWTPEAFIDYEEDDNSIAVEIEINKASHISLKITFSKKLDNLPVKCQLEISEPNGWNGIMWTSTCKWAHYKSTVWVPSEILILHSAGNPKRPSSETEYKLTGYWLFEHEVPEEVFSTKDYLKFVVHRNSVMQRSRIKDLVRED